MAAIAVRWLLARWPYVLGGIAVFVALWWAYSAIWNAGYDEASAEWEARQRAAEAKAAADTKLLNEAIAEIDTGITIDLEAINAVRTIYRDKVVYKAVDVYRDRPDCALPDGLLREVNFAASAYAASASGSGGRTVPETKTPR